MERTFNFTEMDYRRKALPETQNSGDSNVGLNNLFLIFIRAGLNKHFLQEKHHDGLVQAALQLIKDNGEKSKYEKDLKALKSKYAFLNLEQVY